MDYKLGIKINSSISGFLIQETHTTIVHKNNATSTNNLFNENFIKTPIANRAYQKLTRPKDDHNPVNLKATLKYI